MRKVAHDQNTRQGTQFYIRDCIARIDAPVNVKYLLELIQRHSLNPDGKAYRSQEKLAWEMNVSRSAMQRAWRWAVAHKLVIVRRVRTGKGKADQYNEYWLDVDRLKQLRRTEPRHVEHASPAEHATYDHASPAEHADGEHASKSHPSMRQNEHRACSASEAVGLDSKAGIESNADSSKTTPPRQTRAVPFVPTNGHKPQSQTRYEIDLQECIQKNIQSVCNAYQKIHELKTGPDAWMDQTKHEIQTLRKEATRSRKNLKILGVPITPELFGKSKSPKEKIQ